MQTQTSTATVEGRAFRSAALAGEVAMTNRLVSLAALMGLDPLAAVALPAVIMSAARKGSMSEAAMVAECEVNAPLREYLAKICCEADVVGALS